MRTRKTRARSIKTNYQPGRTEIIRYNESRLQSRKNYENNIRTLKASYACGAISEKKHKEIKTLIDKNNLRKDMRYEKIRKNLIKRFG